jgi:predicted amidophosphoribosyltransferase
MYLTKPSLDNILPIRKKHQCLYCKKKFIPIDKYKFLCLKCCKELEDSMNKFLDKITKEAKQRAM